VKVYVVESGCYSEAYIAGVYSSREAAMKAHPVPDSDRNKIRDGGWVETKYGWSNGYDWGDSDTITEYEVDA
jgi:hypothetical protein